MDLLSLTVQVPDSTDSADITAAVKVRCIPHVHFGQISGLAIKSDRFAASLFCSSFGGQVSRWELPSLNPIGGDRLCVGLDSDAPRHLGHPGIAMSPCQSLVCVVRSPDLLAATHVRPIPGQPVSAAFIYPIVSPVDRPVDIDTLFDASRPPSLWALRRLMCSIASVDAFCQYALTLEQKVRSHCLTPENELECCSHLILALRIWVAVLGLLVDLDTHSHGEVVQNARIHSKQCSDALFMLRAHAILSSRFSSNESFWHTALERVDASAETSVKSRLCAWIVNNWPNPLLPAHYIAPIDAAHRSAPVAESAKCSHCSASVGDVDLRNVNCERGHSNGMIFECGTCPVVLLILFFCFFFLFFFFIQFEMLQVFE
jgi:hypothetical protein